MEPREQDKGRTRNRAGFTLAEILVTVLVLAVAVTSLYACIAFAFSLVDYNRQELRATQIGIQKLEAIRLCTWSQLSNCTISFHESYDPTATTNQNSGLVYYGTIGIGACTNVPNSASYKTNMSLVTVALYWTNGSSGKQLTHSYQMQTQIALKGIQNYVWGATP